jgi:RNA polymerase sigma-70 factor (ECF subfamily)
MAYKFREFVIQTLEHKKDFDPQIVELAKTDKEAFAKLYDFYFPKVYAFVMSKTGSSAAAEDIVSDVFMKILENLPKYRDRGLPFTAWLFTVTRNILFDFYAKQKRGETTALEEGLEIKDEKKDFQPDDQARRGELKDKVKQVMDKLPERELSILQLKFFSGLNNREIALVLNLSESNVGIILYRVLRKIKPDLNNLF